MLTCLTNIPPRLWQTKSRGRLGYSIIKKLDMTGTQSQTSFMTHTQCTAVRYACQEAATQRVQIMVWNCAEELPDLRIVPICQNPQVGEIFCQKVLRPKHNLWRWTLLRISLIKTVDLLFDRCVPRTSFLG